MIEGCPRPVWETLPVERQRSLLLTLGRMAMRQIRSPSTPSLAQQVPITEITDDDRRGFRATGACGRVREDLSPPS
jgi:hypothetical protein